MATVTQTIEPAAEMKLFTTIFKEPERFRTSEPMGVVNFHADSDLINAIGAGDDAVLLIRQDLPVGFLYRFKDMYFSLKGTGVGNWLSAAKFAFNFGVDTPTEVSDELNYPVAGALSAQVNGSHKIYSFGGFIDGVDAGRVPFSAPSWLINGRPVGDTTNPVLQLKNNTASTGPWTTGFLFRYDVFPIEQGENSALYWSQPVKEI